MEATLLDLILDVAAALFAHVAQHLAEDELEGVAPHLAAQRTVRVADRLVAVVGDVEGCAVEMARLLRGVGVISAQAADVGLRAEHARDDEAVQGDALHLQRVEEGLADVLEENRGAGHEIGDAGLQRVDAIIGRGSHIDQLRAAVLGIAAVAHRADAPPPGCDELDGVAVGEGLAIAVDAVDAVRQLAVGQVAGGDGPRPCEHLADDRLAPAVGHAGEGAAHECERDGGYSQGLQISVLESLCCQDRLIFLFQLQSYVKSARRQNKS